MDNDKLWKALNLVTEEFKNATKKYGAFNSYHEGYAVILEELDELWDQVKLQNPDKEKLKKEAKQVAAMAIRFLYDCCEV